jgi:6-phosphogluconate dehydrogenase (decarboxylating)
MQIGMVGRGRMGAIEEAVPAGVPAALLFTRSRRHHALAEPILSAMRFGFGDPAGSKTQ